MIDFLAFIIGFFSNLATIGQSKNNYSEEADMQLVEDSKDDSHGDGLVMFDDPLFPEEPDEE